MKGASLEVGRARVVRGGHRMRAKSLRYTVFKYHQHSIFKSMFDVSPYREHTHAVSEQMYITVRACAFQETKCSDLKNAAAVIKTPNIAFFRLFHYFSKTEFPR